jgi:Yip1 domain
LLIFAGEEDVMHPSDESHNLVNPYAPPQSTSMDSGSNAGADASEPGLNPWRTIWTAPRATVRRIAAVNPRLHVLLLTCLAGIGESLDRASMRNLGDQASLPTILAIACVGGPLGGLFGLWLISHLIRLTGRWTGGRGDRDRIKTAMAWASVPSVFSLVLWIPKILLFGSDMFTAQTPRIDSQPQLVMMFYGLAALDVVLGLWSFVLLCNTVAEVQGYRSAWRGFLNLLLAGLAFVVGVFSIVIAFVLVAAALRGFAG